MTFTVHGTYGKKKVKVTWDGGDIIGPKRLVADANDMSRAFTSGPQPLNFDHPDLTDPTQAAAVIEFLLDSITFSDGPRIDWSAEGADSGMSFDEGDDGSEPVRKHYGPGPHPGTGTPQSVHGHKGGGGSGGMSPERRSNLDAAAKAVDAAYEQNQKYADLLEDLNRTFGPGAFDFHTPGEEHGGFVNSVLFDEHVTATGAEVDMAEWMERWHPDVWEYLQNESRSDFFRRHIIRKYVKQHSMSVAGGWAEGRKAAVRSLVKVKEFLDEARPFIRMEPEDVMSVLNSGIVLNQNGTGDSNGWFDPDGRAIIEETLFGYDLNRFDGHTRYPIYGYFSKESLLRSDTSTDSKAGRRWSSNLENYGTVAVELKPGVRSTFMLGDSLDESGVNGGYYGKGVRGPLMGRGPLMMPGDPANPGLETINGIRQLSSPREGVTVESVVRYVEAQYHEPITVDDIKAIHISRWDLEAHEFEFETGDSIEEYLPGNIELVVHG